MLAISELLEHRSIHGLIYAVYVFTAGDGNKPVSSGVKGRTMGSACDPVSVLVGSCPSLLKTAKWSDTSSKTLVLKWLFVTGVVTKSILLSYPLVRNEAEIRQILVEYDNLHLD